MKEEVVTAVVLPSVWMSDEEAMDAFLGMVKAVEAHHRVDHEVAVEWTLDIVCGTLQHCPPRSIVVAWLLRKRLRGAVAHARRQRER